jgi:hypothetical protein
LLNSAHSRPVNFFGTNDTKPMHTPERDRQHTA